MLAYVSGVPFSGSTVRIFVTSINAASARGDHWVEVHFLSGILLTNAIHWLWEEFHSPSHTISLEGSSRLTMPFARGNPALTALHRDRGSSEVSGPAESIGETVSLMPRHAKRIADCCNADCHYRSAFCKELPEPRQRWKRRWPFSSLRLHRATPPKTFHSSLQEQHSNTPPLPPGPADLREGSSRYGLVRLGIVFAPSRFRDFYLRVLVILPAPTEQDHRAAILAEVDTVARSNIDTALMYAIPYRFAVPEVSFKNAV